MANSRAHNEMAARDADRRGARAPLSPASSRPVRRPLDVWPFRLRFRADSPGRRFLGSPWRGALGYHLKHAVCIFRKGECAPCPLRERCLYARCFDRKRAALAPFALYPEWAGDHGDFNLMLVLFGDGAAQLPYFAHALKQAGERGVAGKRFTFRKIEHWRDGGWEPLENRPQPLGSPPEQNLPLRVRMCSPLRFKHDNRYVGAREMSLELWLGALRRRLVDLAGCWGDAGAMRMLCAMDGVGEWHEARWRWREFRRYSRRQQTEMKMGGVTGSFALDAAQAARLWPMLWLGQWTHAGKLATMGFGRYELEVIGG